MSVMPLRTGPRRGGRRRWVLRGAFVAGTIAVIGCASRTARAEAKFGLAWHAEGNEAACVTETAVREAVEAALGHPLFTDRAQADIVIEGRERRDGPRYRARVTQRDRAGGELGSRDLEAETCAALRRMTIVVVTLFVEPDDARAPRPEPADLPQRERAAPSPTGDPRVPPRMRYLRSTPITEHGPRPQLHLGFGAGAAVGLLPGPSASIRVLMRVSNERSRLSFEWGAGYSLPQTVIDGSVHATFSAIDQQTRVCYAAVRAPPFRLHACGGGLFGAILPSTRGIAGGEGSARSLLGPTASIGLRLGEGPANLHIELGLAVPGRSRAPKYMARSGESRTLYTTSPVIGLVSLAGTFALF